MNRHFESDSFPGRPKILFIGVAENSHTRSWIDLLSEAQLNLRLFSRTTGEPPDDWPVRSYVTSYTNAPLDPATRARMYPQNQLLRFAKRGRERLNGAQALDESAGRWLAKILRQWRPDVIHTLGLDQAAYFYRDARERFGLQDIGKWVVQVRGGPDLALHRLLPEYSTRIRDVLVDCDQLIADNQQNYEYALELGLKHEGVSPLGVVPGSGGVDVEKMAASWQGPPSKRRVLLWPKAYDCPQRKATPIIEALKIAWEQIQPCEIFMLGASPETRMWMHTLPDEIRNACRIHDHLPQAKVLELMSRARVVLQTGLADGIPNVMLEAMASGAFPIVSPLETIRTVAEPEQNVLFARALYPDEIAEALIRAMSDDELVDAAAARNLELVRRIGDRAAIRPRVIEFYERLAAVRT